MSFPSKYAPDNAPPGHSSISCEIAYSRRKPLNESGLVERTIDALRRTGILETSDRIVVEDQINIPYAYVVYDFNRESSLRVIHSWMESVGLFPCGRFGEWGYHWSFEAIESGTLGQGSVAEGEYTRNMKEARLCQDNTAHWVEVCYCPTPLEEERPYWEEYFELVRVQDAHSRKKCRDETGEEPWACGECDCTEKLERHLASVGRPFMQMLRTIARETEHPAPTR